MAGKIIAATLVAAGAAVAVARLRPRSSPATGTAQWQPLAPNPAANRPERPSADAAPQPESVDSVDGSCPATHPIKGNLDSGIFHVPGGMSYERTSAERCYVSSEAAIADGLRQAKR